MSNYRIQRINSEAQKALSDIIGNRVRDPKLTDMVTVTRVDTDPDLKNARVYISIYSDDAARKKQNLDAVVRSGGFIRHELARELSSIRQIPMLHFFLDDSIRGGDRIEELLRQINQKS
jgi:ribosome-binding factor A